LSEQRGRGCETSARRCRLSMPVDALSVSTQRTSLTRPDADGRRQIDRGSGFCAFRRGSRGLRARQRSVERSWPRLGRDLSSDRSLSTVASRAMLAPACEPKGDVTSKERTCRPLLGCDDAVDVVEDSSSPILLCSRRFRASGSSSSRSLPDGTLAHCAISKEGVCPFFARLHRDGSVPPSLGSEPVRENLRPSLRTIEAALRAHDGKQCPRLSSL
jgi:hypothetical protein